MFEHLQRAHRIKVHTFCLHQDFISFYKVKVYDLKKIDTQNESVITNNKTNNNQMKIIPTKKKFEVNLTKRDKERTNDSSIFIHNL